MRRNIFQILEEEYDYHTEIKRIHKLFTSILFFESGEKYTPESLVERYAFHNWKQRKRCITLKEMKSILSIDDIVQYTEPSIEEIVLYLEYVLNILYLAWGYINSGERIKYYTDYDMLKENIDTLLDNINHEVHYFDDEEMVLISVKSAEATAVAEIIDQDLSVKVIKYNHYLLKGDISEKRNIILALADRLEPKRKQIEGIDRTLASNLFYLLNNINIRHNNKSKDSNHFKEYIARMKNSQLEKWYDETYQLELLAFLLLDNIKRNKKVDSLKSKMEEI